MKYKKAITALALAALLLAGCAAPQAVQAPAPQQTAKAAETQSGVTFTDAMGYPVTVQSWNRVVSLYGSFAETWTLAGGTLAATTEDAIKERGLDLGTDIAVIGTCMNFCRRQGCRTPISKPVHLMNTLPCCAPFVI